MFNSMTFGNELKPAYNFDASSENLFKVDFAAEEMLEWAKENNMKVRGHVLVWHSQVDPSIFAIDYQAYADGKLTKSDTAKLDEECLVDREELLARLKRYIYGVLEYTYKNGYADVIYAWDVVNEAADENQYDGLRRSYWYQIIGPDYLYYAFYMREKQRHCMQSSMHHFMDWMRIQMIFLPFSQNCFITIIMSGLEAVAMQLFIF